MNPLRWEHHGLRAHTVAAYDAIEAVDAAAELLEDIRTDSVNAQDEAAKWLRDFENAMSPRPNGMDEGRRTQKIETTTEAL